LNAKDQAQRTPLLYAIEYYVQEANDTFKQHLAERITLIDYLLDQGAELQAADENGNTALHLGMPIYELGQHLIERGADIHALNKEGETAIFQVVTANYPERQVKAYLQTLLDKGLDINARNKYNESLLSKAVRHDKIQVMTYLLEHGADPTVGKDTSPEQAGFTLPMYIVNRAASSTAQKIQLLSLLKDKGADFNALNTRGENLLFVAVQNSEPSYDLLNWLLEQGVSAQVLNQQGQSLLHLLVTSALSFVGSETEQATARQQLVNRLIQQGLNINARDMNGRSALIYALQQQRHEWIMPLLNAGINPNLQDNTESSALALAIERFSADANKDLSLIKDLLAKGANPNQRNSLGETSLFLAYRANNTELIELLLTHGANPQLRSYYGKIAGQT
jgi:ankyrin repeat protein